MDNQMMHPSALALALLATPAAAATWPFYGADTHNTRNAAAETTITPANVHSLALKWTFTASGDIRANPTVESNALYVTARAASKTTSGFVYRLNATTGALVWSQPISTLVPNSPNASSSTAPAIAANFIVIGLRDPVNGATLLALNKSDGTLVWRTVIDPLATATIRNSPVIAGTTIFTGTSSSEETSTGKPGYTVTFRGSVQAVDLTGKKLWSFSTVPAGYTGAAVWGSNFAIDTKRGSLYAATGNNYTIPAAAQTCVQAAKTAPKQRACLDPNNYEDSILALDLKTGALKWGRSFIGADTALYDGPDYDFASAPSLFTTTINGTPTDILGAGHKSGAYYALNPATGKTIWTTQAGPGGPDGGIQWGSATDGHKIYTAIVNSAHTPTSLGPPSNLTNWQGGSWQALDAATGQIQWQVPVAGTNPLFAQYPAGGSGALTYANGVVFAPSLSGAMTALDAATGATLWTYQAASSVAAGATVINGYVYWGSGDNDAPNGSTAGNTLYAFGF